MTTNSLEQIKTHTLAIIGSNNPDDVAYITQELIDIDYQEEDFSEPTVTEEIDGKARRVFYGHNMSYDGNNYRYQRGHPGILENACGHDRDVMIPFSKWDHESLTTKCKHGTTEHSYITRFIEK